MGLQHRRHVWNIPEGFVTDSQRLLLLVLADETHDERMQWGHNHEKLREMLGGWSETKLVKNLRELETAQFITRRKQRRKQDGTGGWENQNIYLGGLVHEAYYEPTESAIGKRKRTGNLRVGPPNV